MALTSAMGTALIGIPVHAQSLDKPPVFKTVDGRDVELSTGRLMLKLGQISIGPDGPGGLSFGWGVESNTLAPGGYIYAPGFASGAKFDVVLDQSRETFTFTGTISNPVFTQDQGRGSTLTYSSSTNKFTYVAADGTTAIFDSPYATYYYGLHTKTYPTGEVLTYYGRAVTSSLGYQLRFGTNASGQITSAVVFNMANETCDPAAASCTLTGSWPTITRDFSTWIYSDSLNRQIHVTGSSSNGIDYYYIAYPSGKTLTYGTTMVYPDGPPYIKVLSYSDGAGSWTYQYPYPGGTTLVFGPGNPAPEAFQFNAAGELGLYQPADGSGNSEIYTYDSKYRLTTHSLPGGGQVNYTYDARGNMTQSTVVSTTPGTPANIVKQAHYPTTCTNQKICNQPDYTLDAKTNRTDYTYNASTGQIATVAGPAAAVGGIRPTTTYSYTNYQAYYRNSSGAIVASGLPVSKLTKVSACITTASCANTADEAVTTTAYGPQTAGTANNLLPVGITQRAGDSSVTATTTLAYYPTGDLKAVDGPLSGSADTTRIYYDVMREPTGQIGPDPDGGGALLNRATRATYNGDGQVITEEVGTATNQGDTGMSTFSSVVQTNTTYDAQDRPKTKSVTAGGTTYTMTQYSYKTNGLPECTTQRMNPATYTNLPANACTLATQGSLGPDRITKKAWDNAFRLTSATEGLGTTAQVASLTKTYTAAGLDSTVTDGENNKTTYVYDGMNRLQKVQYPIPAKGSGTSSTTDYEQYSYDPNGNVTSVRLRDGTSIAYVYDNLDRVISKDLPGTEATVTYTYDLLGRARTATQGSFGLTNSYDTLGRLLSEGEPYGTMTYQYDAAGHRTKATWGDGFYVNYDYLVSGEVSKIRENGATSGAGVLATYGYNNLGSITSITRGNGTVTELHPRCRVAPVAAGAGPVRHVERPGDRVQL